MSVRILNADALTALPHLEAESVHAIVTDPPAGISFMGKDWDSDKGGRDHWIAWMQEVAAECLRVCKPGGHALVWALPRTSHWTATAWENAGWQVRDRCAHLFGSGFPKSLDVSKAIDRAACAEREVVGFDAAKYRPNRDKHLLAGQPGGGGKLKADNGATLTAPATPEAAAWSGWGTALKPACEDWWLLRKPLEKGLSVAANTLRHGCGGLNIDACRVPAPDGKGDWPVTSRTSERGSMAGPMGAAMTDQSTGRWPANVLHDGSPEVEEAFARFGSSVSGGDTGSPARFFASLGDNDPLLPSSANAILQECQRSLASDVANSSTPLSQSAASVLTLAVTLASCGAMRLSDYSGLGEIDTEQSMMRLCSSVITTIQNIGKSASLALPLDTRSPSESRARVVVQTGLTGITTITISHWKSDGSAAPVTCSITPSSILNGGLSADQNSRFHFCGKADATDRVGSLHPTVKPQSLMSWLVQLVTPPNGTVLDPFAGTGSTGLAADRLGMNAVLIERDAQYAADARRKIASDAPLFTEVA